MSLVDPFSSSPFLDPNHPLRKFGALSLIIHGSARFPTALLAFFPGGLAGADYPRFVLTGSVSPVDGAAGF